MNSNSGGKVQSSAYLATRPPACSLHIRIGEYTFKGQLTKRENLNANSVSILYCKSYKISMIIIASSFVATIFIGYYNYAIAGTNNPSFIGINDPDYIRRLKEMLELDPASLIAYISSEHAEDRSLYLVFQYLCFLVSCSTPNIFIAYHMPIILTWPLMLSTFLLRLAVVFARVDCHACDRFSSYCRSLYGILC